MHVMADTFHDGRLIEVSWSEPERFAELFDRRYAAVRAFCVRRIGVHDGDDAAGETFCRAFQYRGRYDVSRPDARPWLFGIALNVVRSQQRSSVRRTRAYLREAMARSEVDDPGVVAATSLDARRDLAAVAGALAELPDDELDVLLLHVWEGVGYADIAQAVGVPIGTVRSRLFRARQRLRAVLECNPSASGGPHEEAREPEMGVRHES